MAAKTCLLCGKALSRIFAGGEEFCSREHRNQYRLRRGMERLVEANQVASVMRRREFPRQIPVDQLYAEGAANPKVFAEPRPWPEDGGPHVPQIAPAISALSHGAEFLRPMAQGTAAPMSLPGPVVALSDGASLAPATPPSLYAHVASAPPIRPKATVANIAARRRSVLMPRLRKPSGAVLRQAPIGAPAVPGAPYRKAEIAAAGRALRVSLSTGFRVPEWKMRAAALEPSAIAGIRWPSACALDARARVKAAPIAAAIDITQQESRIPAAPAAVFEGRFEWPDTVAIRIEFMDVTTGHRSAFVPISSPEERK